LSFAVRHLVAIFLGDCGGSMKVLASGIRGGMGTRFTRPKNIPKKPCAGNALC
jgi:hypothetical protein